MTSINPDIDQWLKQLHDQETSLRDPQGLDKPYYEKLLRELGYSDGTLASIDNQANVLQNQANAHWQAGNLEEATVLMERARACAPWREDFVPVLASLRVERLQKHYSAEGFKRAEHYTRRWIDQEKDNTRGYELLEELRRIDHRQKKRMRNVYLLVGSCIALISTSALLVLQTPAREGSGASEDRISAPMPSEGSHLSNSKGYERDRSKTAEVTKTARTGLERQPLPVEFNVSQHMEAVSIDSGRSILETNWTSNSKSGSLRIKFKNQGKTPIYHLAGTVNWQTSSGEVIRKKSSTMVRKGVGLYPGESAVYSASEFGLPMHVDQANVQFDFVEAGSVPGTRDDLGGACVITGEGISNVDDFTVQRFNHPKTSIQSDLFAIVSHKREIRDLQVYPRYFDASNKILEKPSKRSILNNVIIASSFGHQLDRHEFRPFLLSTFIDQEERAKIAKTCVVLTTTSLF